MTDEDLRGLVEQLGAGLDFGEYELSIYLTVLEQGELAATDLPNHTDVPKTRVYDTARDLERRGLVEIQEGRPMKLRAVDPSEVFDEMQSSLDELVEELGQRYVDPGWTTDAVSLVTSRRSILRHLDQVVESAEYELSVAVPPSLLDRLAPALRELVDEGVHVSLLLSPAADAPAAEDYPYEEVATAVRTRRGVTTPVVAVADGEVSVYATREAVQGNERRYGVIFNRSTLGFLAYGFYSSLLWSTSQEITEAREPQPFPRQYASIRRCVRDLLQNRGPFRASIEGRDVMTGDPRTVEGSIVDTTLDPGKGVASLTIETEDGRVTVGGRVATYEDVESHRAVVERD